MENLQDYYNRCAKNPVIKKQLKINDLIARAKRNDTSAATQVVNNNLRLIIKIAASFYPYEQQELIAAGELAVLECIATFNPKKKTAFSTYIYKRIKGSMLACMGRERLLNDLFDENFEITDQRGINEQDEIDLLENRALIESCINQADLKPEEKNILNERYLKHGTVRTFRDVSK